MNRNQYPCVEFDLDKFAANLAALVERCHDSLIEVAGVVKAVSSLPEIVRVYEERERKIANRFGKIRGIIYPPSFRGAPPRKNAAKTRAGGKKTNKKEKTGEKARFFCALRQNGNKKRFSAAFAYGIA